MKPKVAKRKTRKYAVHGLDVWGNKRDGFWVNDVYPSSGTIALREGFTDAKLVAKLKSEGYIKKGIHTKSIDIVGDDPEFSMTIEDARNGRPELELRPVREDD
jgi:hypothetical protein